MISFILGLKKTYLSIFILLNPSFGKVYKFSAKPLEIFAWINGASFLTSRWEIYTFDSNFQFLCSHENLKIFYPLFSKLVSFQNQNFNIILPIMNAVSCCEDMIRMDNDSGTSRWQPHNWRKRKSIMVLPRHGKPGVNIVYIAFRPTTAFRHDYLVKLMSL